MLSLRALLFHTLFLATASHAQTGQYRSLTLGERGLSPILLRGDLSEASRLLGINIKTSAFHYGDEDCSSYALGLSEYDWDIRFITVGGKIGKIDIFIDEIRTKEGVGVGSTGAEIRQAYGDATRVLPAHDASESLLRVKTRSGTLLEFVGPRAKPIQQRSQSQIEMPEKIRYYSIGLPNVGTTVGCL